MSLVDKDLKNPLARKNGRIITIHDLDENLDRGLACDSFCPCCDAPFEARMGEIRVWHFAHSGTPCDQTLSFINGLYELTRDAVLLAKEIVLPPIYAKYFNSTYAPGAGKTSISSFMKPGYKIVKNGFSKVVSKTEFVTGENGMIKALIINDGELAIRIMADIKYCIDNRPTPYEGLSTIVIDFGKRVYEERTETLYQAIVKNPEVKAWLYAPETVEWENREKEEERILYEERKAEEARRIAEKNAAAEREKEEQILREKEREAERIRQEEEKKRVRADVRNREIKVFFEQRPKTKKVYDILNNSRHIEGRLCYCAEGNKVKTIHYDSDINIVEVRPERNAIIVGKTGAKGWFFIQELMEDVEDKVLNGTRYTNIDLRMVRIENIAECIKEMGFEIV